MYVIKKISETSVGYFSKVLSAQEGVYDIVLGDTEKVYVYIEYFYWDLEKEINRRRNNLVNNIKNFFFYL